MEDTIHFINIRLVDIEEQGVFHFTRWKEHDQAAVGQVNVEDISVKTLQQELIELTN